MLKTTLAFFCHRAMRNHRLLPALALAEEGGSVLLLILASVALALFVWLLTLHPAASGRVYAAYGGVYVCTALLWLPAWWTASGSARTTGPGALIALCGMLIIVAGWGGPRPPVL